MAKKKKPEPVNGAPVAPDPQQSAWDSEIVCQWAQHVQERSAAVEKARVAAIEAREAYKQAKRILREREGMLTTALAQPPGTFPLFDRKPVEAPRFSPTSESDPRERVRDLYRGEITPLVCDDVGMKTWCRENNVCTIGAVLDATMFQHGRCCSERLVRLIAKHATGNEEQQNHLAHTIMEQVRAVVATAEALEVYWPGQHDPVPEGAGNA